MMLGLKDSKGDAGCEYESLSVTTVQKKCKSGRKGRAVAKSRKGSNSPKNSYLMLEGAGTESVLEKTGKVKDPVKTMKQEGLKSNTEELEQVFKEKQNAQVMKDENSALLYESPEQNEENSKAFMESIGCWINDLFSVPNKRNSSPKGQNEVLNKELPSEEDAEYLKSISAIKEQFRKKLKNETTVHISVPETPFELNFDKVLDNPKKQKKRPKTIPLENNSDWLEQFNQNLEVGNECPPQKSNGLALVMESEKKEKLFKPVRQKNTLELDPVNLAKDRKKVKQQSRRNVTDLEDYAFPKAGELSKKILLNVSDQEKFAQFYKNTHLAAQDYGQRKGKTYQSTTRCYTTKAKGRGKFNPGTFFSSSSAAPSHQKGFGEFLSKTSLDHRKKSFRNSSRKPVSELSRDSMSFSRDGTFVTVQESRNESNSPSEDLVKYLMKKLKSGRPQLVKKKGRTKVPQVLAGPKNRFMQSATNSLVMTVMAKKENEGQLSSKSASRFFVEGRGYPSRELLLKQSETALRLDVSRALNGTKVGKSAYIDNDVKLWDEGFGSGRNSKQSYEDLLKRETHKTEKYQKRQEVKRMLSSLDMKEVLPMPKLQAKKEQMKKQSLSEESTLESAECQNPRFQKQHELFKRNNKTGQNEEVAVSTEGVEEVKAKEAQDSSNVTSPATELAVIVPVAQAPENVQENKRATEQPNEAVESEPATAVCKSPDSSRREAETFCKEKPLYMKLEKKIPDKAIQPKEKAAKVKSLSKTINEPQNSNSKSLMNPLIDLCNSEQNHREAARSYVHIPPKELAPGKLADSLLINRRFSTKAVTDFSLRPVPWNQGSPISCLLEMDKSKCKKKDKKKSLI